MTETLAQSIWNKKISKQFKAYEILIMKYQKSSFFADRINRY
jgi:hypothetical protein